MHEIDRARQGVESLAQAADGRLRLRGKRQAAVDALEQLHPEVILQQLHLLADRRRRHMQVVGGATDAAVTR